VATVNSKPPIFSERGISRQIWIMSVMVARLQFFDTLANKRAFSRRVNAL
jgi:hypothetical protein